MQIHKRTIEKENKSTNKDRFLFTVYVNINDLVTNFGISFVLEYTSTNKKECSFWFFFHNLNFFLFLIMWRNNEYMIIFEDVCIWTKCLWFARRSYFSSLFIFIALYLKLTSFLLSIMPENFRSSFRPTSFLASSIPDDAMRGRYGL